MKTDEEMQRNTGKLTYAFLLRNFTQKIEAVGRGVEEIMLRKKKKSMKMRDLVRQDQWPSWSLLKNGTFQEWFHGKDCEEDSSVIVRGSLRISTQQMLEFDFHE